MKLFPKTTNIVVELTAWARECAAAIAATHPRVEGIVLTGGAARGFADQYSDLDLDVFVPDRSVTVKAPRGYERPPQGNYFELERRCLNEWKDRRNDERVWTMANRWDKSHAQILYDPRGTVAALFRKKLVFRPGEFRELLRDARNDPQWLAIGVASDWVARGNLAAAHHNVSRGLELLLDYLFLKNRQFIPHEKWKLFFAEQLEILPARFSERVRDILLVRELSAAELKRRQAVFLPLLKETQNLPNLTHKR